MICILLSEIGIWPLRKTWLMVAKPVGNHRGQTFLVVGHQVCTHLRRDFVSLLFADPLQVIKVSRLTFVNSNLQLPPQIFYEIKVWRLARPLQDLNVLLLEPPLVALAMCFGTLSCWKTHPRPIFNALAGFNALALTVHGPVHRPFDAVQLSCPLSRKTPPKHNISTSMFDGGDGVHGVIGSIPPPPNTANELMPKSWILVSSYHNTFTQFSSESLANFRRACTCAFLSRGTLRALQDFSPSRRSMLPIVFLVTMVPAALRSLTRLIPHRSLDHWNSTRWDLAWSLRPREIDSYFVFLPFANNRTNCCHLLTKLLGDGLVAHSSLV